MTRNGEHMTVEAGQPPLTPFASVAAEDEGLDFGAYLLALQRRWRLVAFFVLISLFLGGAYVLFKRKIYEADAVIAIEDQSNPLASGDFNLMGLGGKTSIDQEKITLSSRTLAEEVVRKLRLDYRIESDTKGDLPLRIRNLKVADELIDEELELRFGDGRYQVDSKSFGNLGDAKLGEALTSRYLDILVERNSPETQGVIRITRVDFQWVVAIVRNSVEVRDLGKYSKGNVLFLTVRSPNPEKARDIANMLTEVYIQRSIDRLGKEANQTMSFLEEQLDVIRSSLELGEKSLNDFKSEKGVFLLEDEAKALISEISQLEVQRSELNIQRHQLVSVRHGLATGKVSRFLLADLAAGSSALLNPMVNSLSESLVELQALKEELVDSNSQVKSLQARVNALKKRIRNAVDNSLAAVNKRIQGTSLAIDKYEAKLKGLPETERQMAVLTRTATVNAELYIFLLKSYEEARIRRAQVVSSVDIIDPAITPEYPILPRKKMTLFISLVFGLILGVAAAIFVDFQIDPITDADALERKYGYPVVTTIPRVRAEDLALSRQSEFKSPLSEATGLLRAHARFMAKNSQSWRILMTSPLPGEGKSTTAMNLAVALGASGEKTLLMDCDLRFPRLHREKQLDIKQDLGLVDILVGDSKLEDVVHRQVQPNLDVLTAGKTTSFPAEILSSDEMKKLVQEETLKAGYRYTIMDSPPGILFSDPIVLSSIVDGVYIVLLAGQSQGHSLSTLLSHLRKVNADIKGLVLNQVVSGSSGAYGYKYRYGKYGYGYGYEKGYGQEYGYGYGEGYGYGYGGKSKRKKKLLHRALDWLIG